MTKKRRKILYYGLAIALYSWCIVMIWIGPSWQMDGRTYLLTAVVPAFLGVVSISKALQLHMQSMDGTA
jgi:hypothetical protein